MQMKWSLIESEKVSTVHQAVRLCLWWIRCHEMRLMTQWHIKSKNSISKCTHYRSTSTSVSHGSVWHEKNHFLIFPKVKIRIKEKVPYLQRWCLPQTYVVSINVSVFQYWLKFKCTTTFLNFSANSKSELISEYTQAHFLVYESRIWHDKMFIRIAKAVAAKLLTNVQVCKQTKRKILTVVK